MPSFETQYEQDKWNKLAGLAKKSMRRAKEGSADVDDVEIVKGIMKEFGDTVASTIENTTAAVHKAAKIQTSRTNEARKRKGKKPYDKVQLKLEYEKNLQDLLETQAIEIILAVEGILKDEFAKLGIDLNKVAEDVKEHVSDEASLVRESVQDAKDEVIDRIEKLEEFQYEMFEALLDSCCPEGKETGREEEVFTQDGESPEQLIDRLLGGGEDEELDLLDAIIEEHLDGIEDRLGEQLEEQDDFTNHVNSLLGEAQTVTLDQLQEDEDESVTDDFTEHLDKLLGQDRESVERRSESLSDELSDLNDALEGLGYRETGNHNRADKEENRKAETWIRALSRSWLGRKTKDAYNTGASIGMALLKAAGAVLATSLMGGNLWEYIKDYLSVEKLKEYGTEFYNYLSTKTRQLLSYITSKLLPGSDPYDPDAFTSANVSNSVLSSNNTSSSFVSGVVTPAPQAPYDPVHIAKQKDVYLPGSESLKQEPSASLPSSQGAIVNPSNTEVSFGGYKHDLTSVVENSPVMNRSSFTVSPTLSEVYNNPVAFNQKIANQNTATNASSSSDVTHVPISVQKATMQNPEFTPSVVHKPEAKGEGPALSQMPSIFSIPNASGSPGLGLINVGLLTGS